MTRHATLTLALSIAMLAIWRLATIAYYDHGLFVDEAQYIDWGREPALGYYSKPPVLAWAIAGARAACGEGAVCMRGLALLFYSLAAVCVFLAGRRLFDARVGLTAAVLYLLLPGIALTGLFITTDAPLALFTAAALLFMTRALQTGSWADWLALGACLGLGMMSKYSFALLAVGFVAYLALTPGRRALVFDARFLACTAVALLIFLPNVAWNWQHSFVTFTHTAEISELDAPGVNPLRLAEYVGGQLLVFGPLSFAALLAAPWLRGGVLSTDGGRLLATLAWFAFGAFAVLALLSRTLLNWAYVAFAPAILLVAAVWLRGGYTRWLKGSIAVSLLIIVAAQHLPTWTQLASIELTRGQDPYSRTKGWKQLGAAVSETWAAHPGTRLLADDRWIMAELLYYARPVPHDAAMWNPSRRLSDHYRLTRDAGHLAGETFLFVTRKGNVASMAPYFDAAQLVREVPIRTHPDSTKTYRIYLLRGFKGY